MGHSFTGIHHNIYLLYCLRELCDGSLPIALLEADHAFEKQIPFLHKLELNLQLKLSFHVILCIQNNLRLAWGCKWRGGRGSGCESFS